MDPSKAAHLHEAERLLSQLDSKVRSAKVKAATALEKISIYPDLISDTSQFLHSIMTPVLMHFSDDAEKVRELCVSLCLQYVRQLRATNLIDTLTYVLPPVYARLKEGSEPAEQIRLSLMGILLQLVEYCGPDSYPSSWDQFVPPLEPVLKAGFKATDAEMKKLTCTTLDAVLSKSTPGAFHPYGLPLMKALLPNCQHRHNEVRRVSLLTMGRVLVASGNSDEVDKIHEILPKLVYDKNAAVRQATIEFLRMMLVDHPMRHVMYHPLMLSLLYFIGPLVPLRPIYSAVPPKQATARLAEAELAFAVAVDIGRQHEEDKYNDFRKELQYFEEEKFDDTRSIPRGLTHIVQDVFPKWMDRLLPMLSDWTENQRKFAYLAMRSALHLAFAYSTRYVPQIIRALSVSLRDFKAEANESLQVAAVLATHVPADDIITVLLPQLTVDGPPGILLLLSTTTLNDNPNDGELGTILDGLQEAAVYEAIGCLDSLVQLLLAMIKRSTEFADVNAVNLLTMVLKISEHKNVVDEFADVFGRPLGAVMSDHLQMLLMSPHVSPLFLERLLPVVDPSAIKGCQTFVCKAIVKVFQKSVPSLSLLIQRLALNNSFEDLLPDFIESILATGREAISMLKTLIETNSIEGSIYNRKSEVLLRGILDSMSQSDDEERLIAIQAMKEFEEKAVFEPSQFSTVYGGLIERLKDHMIAIRVCAADVLGSYLPKCQELDVVLEKFPEIVVSVDDESEEIRNAVADLCRCLAKVDKWKPIIIETVEKQNNYHSEAAETCQALLQDLKQ